MTAGDRPAPLGESDIDFLYAVALGRAPESDEARTNWIARKGSAREVLADLLASAEFMLVEEALRFGTGLGGRFEQPLTATGLRWARATFGDVAANATTWLQLLLRLATRDALPERPAASGEPPRPRALADLAQGVPAPDAAVVARIEHAGEDRVSGWAVDVADPDRRLRLEVWMDGRFVRVVVPDRFRRDLQDRYGSGEAGFDVALPGNGVAGGGQRRLELRTVEGRSLDRAITNGAGAERMDAIAALRAELGGVKAALQRIEAALPEVRERTAFTVEGWDDYARIFYGDATADAPSASETPVRVEIRSGSGSASCLRRALESLRDQTHARWHVRLAADVLAERGRADMIVAALDDRRIVWDDGSGERSRAALTLFMSADDALAPDALARLLALHEADGSALVLYADDDRTFPAGDGQRSEQRTDPHLKPPFDPYWLLQQPYIGSVYALDATLLNGAPELLEPQSDHARLLAATDRAGRDRVRHLARVLSHRMADVALKADVEAVQAALARRGVAAAVEPHGDAVGAPLSGALRLRARDLQTATVSVIISTRDRLDLLRPCVESILASRRANAVEMSLVVIDNGGVEAEAAAYLRGLGGQPGVEVLRDEAPFNWAAINTRAALAQSSEVLVFLNDDTMVLSPDWCDELVFWARQSQVGAVGARLLYGDGTVQHAGVALGRRGSANHEGVGEPGGEGGYLGRRKLVHAAAAVTGACLATRTEVFRRMGGFDGGRFGVAFNDIDYCLRLAESGLDCVYTPHATLHHHESKSRGFGDVHDRAGHAQAMEEYATFRDRHREVLARDPWMNAHFEPEAHAFTLLGPPPTLR